MEVLQEKHLEARPEMDASFNRSTGAPPALVPLDITAYTVTKLVCLISDGSGPGGTNEAILQNWLLRYGEASAELRKIVA